MCLPLLHHSRQIPTSTHPSATLPPGISQLEGTNRKALRLFEAFEALPSEDKQVFAEEVLKRGRELLFDSGPMAEAIEEVDRPLFSCFDEEEYAFSMHGLSGSEVGSNLGRWRK